MTTRATYPGTCSLCGGTFNKAAMTRHIKTCKDKQAVPEGSKKQKTWLVSVDGDWRPEYWMHLEVPASALLRDLDQFLRSIWLECCGHLSAFTIEGVRYELDTGMVDAMWKDFFGPSQPTKSMGVKLYSIFQPGLKFHHEYDFGTTTDLRLKVIAESQRFEQNKEIRVLARNLPPEIPCEVCGKPAKLVCGSCMYMGKGWVCKRCARKHECGEDMLLPVVNSPRVGMCGYTGDGWD